MTLASEKRCSRDTLAGTDQVSCQQSVAVWDIFIQGFKASAQENTSSSFTFSHGHACVPMLAHVDMLVCTHVCSRGYAYVCPCLLTWTYLCAFMLPHVEAKVDVRVFFSHLATLLVFFPKEPMESGCPQTCYVVGMVLNSRSPVSTSQVPRLQEGSNPSPSLCSTGD